MLVVTDVVLIEGLIELVSGVLDSIFALYYLSEQHTIFSLYSILHKSKVSIFPYSMRHMEKVCYVQVLILSF